MDHTRKQAPMNDNGNLSDEVKCNWRKCAGGMGMAGRGRCFLKGEWWNKECPCFITDKEFEEEQKNKTINSKEEVQ